MTTRVSLMGFTLTAGSPTFGRSKNRSMQKGSLIWSLHLAVGSNRCCMKQSCSLPAWMHKIAIARRPGTSESSHLFLRQIWRIPGPEKIFRGQTIFFFYLPWQIKEKNCLRLPKTSAMVLMGVTNICIMLKNAPPSLCEWCATVRRWPSTYRSLLQRFECWQWSTGRPTLRCKDVWKRGIKIFNISPNEW